MLDIFNPSSSEPKTTNTTAQKYMIGSNLYHASNNTNVTNTINNKYDKVNSIISEMLCEMTGTCGIPKKKSPCGCGGCGGKC